MEPILKHANRKVAIWVKWNHIDHIVHGEYNAAVAALEHDTRSKHCAGKMVIIISDSISTIWAGS